MAVFKTSKLAIVSWNTHSINDGTNYKANFPESENGFFNASPVSLTEVKRPGNPPILAAKEIDGKSFVIQIKMLDDPETQIAELKGWFDLADETPHALILEDVDTDAEWYIMCTPAGHPEYNRGGYTEFLMRASDPYLYSNSEVHEQKLITASGQTKTFTVGGIKPVRPRYVFKPTAAGGTGYAYRRWIPVINPNTTAWDQPLDIVEETPGTKFDTATLVTAGKMQADCDDLRVKIDGAWADRWLTDVNTDHTGVWITGVKWKPDSGLTLSGNIADAGAVTTIAFKSTKANKKNILAWPSSGTLYFRGAGGAIGEAFKYTNLNTSKLTATITLRAACDTSMAAHTDGDAVYWIEHDIWLFYGNATATAQEVDDTYKPIFELDASSNISWHFHDFADTAKLRGGILKSTLIKSSNTRDLAHPSEIYTATQLAAADPASVMGMVIRAFQVGAVWKAENAQLAWDLYHPGGITEVTVSGYKYRAGVSWPLAQCLRSNDGKVWTAVWTDATPSAAANWEALAAHAAVALGATYKYLRFQLNGAVSAAADNLAAVEYDDLTVVPDSTKVPYIALGAETGNYHLQARLTNNGTGEWIQLDQAMSLNHTLEVDTEEQTVTYDDGTNCHAALSMDDESRLEWLELAPGSVTLQFDDPSTAGLTLDIYYREKYA